MAAPKEAKVKEPKWKSAWREAVGDHRYLAIKNFEKYQDGITTEWIKNDLEEDFDETPLTGLERWLLGSLRRWRGRRRENLPASCEEFRAYLSATNTHHTDRSHIPHAILTLIAHGFLVPTNQRLSFEEKSRVEKSKARQTKQGQQEDENAFNLPEES